MQKRLKEISGAKPKAIIGVYRLKGGTPGHSSHVRHHGEPIAKFFSDVKHGGPDGSYKAALKWRKKMGLELGIDNINVRLNSNETGIPGVRRIKNYYCVHVTAMIPVSKQRPEQKALEKAVKLGSD